MSIEENTHEPPVRFWEKPSVGNWLSILGLMAALAGSYAIAQAQIAEHERRLIRLEVRDEWVRELLVRIDERTEEMKRRADREK